MVGSLKCRRFSIDQAVTLSLERGADVPPALRQQVISAAGEALPEGYEQAVGAYYKAISGGSE